MSRTQRLALFNVIVAVGVVLDQLSKAWARTALASGPMTLIPGIMNLQLVMNTGAAFSIGSGSTWIFIIIALIVVIAAEVWTARTQDMPLALVCSLACVASGGVGNLVDRIFAGEVTDFFATAFMNFPVFNVADIFVTCGVVVAFIVTLRWNPDSAGTGHQQEGAGHPGSEPRETGHSSSDGKDA